VDRCSLQYIILPYKLPNVNKKSQKIIDNRAEKYYNQKKSRKGEK